MSKGIKIGDKHTFEDWGLSLMKIEVQEPETITHIIEIPGRRTALDLTEAVYGEATYRTRALKFHFVIDKNNYSGWATLDSAIKNYCHGKRMKVVLDTDPGWYWIGRISVSSSKEMLWLTNFEITVDAEPYKYSLESTIDDWLWDPFNFVDGVIRNYNNITIPNNKTIRIIGSPVPVTPKVKASQSQTVTINGKSWSLTANTWKELTGLRIGREYYDFVFSGTGTVSIEFREESL